MPIGTDLDDPSHEVRRVVDRLRVVADRLSPDQHQAVRETVQWLAETAATAQGRPRRPVPVVRPHGLADQVQVLAEDVLAEAPAQAAQVGERLAGLRRRL